MSFELQMQNDHAKRRKNAIVFQNMLKNYEINKAYEFLHNYHETDFSIPNEQGISCIETWAEGILFKSWNGCHLAFFATIERGNGLQPHFLSKYINGNEAGSERIRVGETDVLGLVQVGVSDKHEQIRVIDVIAKHAVMFQRVVAHESLHALLKQPTPCGLSIFCAYLTYKNQIDVVDLPNISKINELIPTSLVNEVMPNGDTLLTLSLKRRAFFDQLVQRQDIYIEPQDVPDQKYKAITTQDWLRSNSVSHSILIKDTIQRHNEKIFVVFMKTTKTTNVLLPDLIRIVGDYLCCKQSCFDDPDLSLSS